MALEMLLRFPGSRIASADDSGNRFGHRPRHGSVTAKIIEFPRSWTPPPLRSMNWPNRSWIVTGLASWKPRKLFRRLQPWAESRLSLRSNRKWRNVRASTSRCRAAALARRILSAAIDGVIIAAACVLFGFIFWKMTSTFRPPRFQMHRRRRRAFAACSGPLTNTCSWFTPVLRPGLLLARLELARFDGNRACRRLRRWRVLASFLSALSLGMGYVWVFLDEDSLCWHDRITHTYLAPKQVTGLTDPDN